MRSRKKNPMFRKQKTEKEKKELKEIKDRNRGLKIIDKLYELPLDIKIKIFQMAVESHMYSWCDKFHMMHMKYLEELFRDIWWFRLTGPTGYDEVTMPRIDFDHKKQGIKQHWERNFIQEPWEKINLLYLKKKKLCRKNVDENEHTRIQSIYSREGSIIPSKILAREWANNPNYYWVHEKCRCSHCDFIRIQGYKDLSNSDKKKYARIKMHDLNQWEITTITQHKEKKEHDRLRN